jgi:hypothetical protein
MWFLAFAAAAIFLYHLSKNLQDNKYIGKHNMQYLQQMGASKPFNKSFMDSSNTLAACSTCGKQTWYVVYS